MSEHEQKIPDLKEVPPDQIEDVVKLLEEMGMVNLKGESSYLFEVKIGLTKTKQVDVHILWDCDKKTHRDSAIVLDALTNGTLNKQILLALNYLPGSDGDKADAVHRLIRRWSRLQEQGEEQPFIDSFQPLVPEQR